MGHIGGVPGFEPEMTESSLLPLPLAIPQEDGGGGRIRTTEPKGTERSQPRLATSATLHHGAG